MYKDDLALKNLPWLISHKTKPLYTWIMIPIKLKITTRHDKDQHISLYFK